MDSTTMDAPFAASQCPLAADGRFGPRVATACRAFDFTLLFEQSILRLGPAALFVLLALVRLCALAPRPRCTPPSPVLAAKLACAALLAALQIALLAILPTSEATTRAGTGGLLSSVSVASSAVLLLSYVVLAALLCLEHLRTIRPSDLISVYLLVFVPLEAVHVRTLWLVSGRHSVPVAAITSASLAVDMLLLALESMPKPRPPSSAPLPGKEETGGIFTKSFYLWLVELLRLGQHKILGLDDLPPLEPCFLSEELTRRFEHEWQTANQEKPGAMFLAIVRALRWHVLAPVFPRLCQMAFTFAQPFLIMQVLAYQNNSTDSHNIGYGLIGAYAFVYVGIALATSWYQYLMYRWITLARGILVSVIYSKALDVSLSVAKDSQALTLMSSDVERIVVGLQATHEVWAAALQVAVAAWLLHNEIGLPFFLPILFCFFCGFIALILSIFAGKRQVRWLDSIKERLASTSAMLKSMKGVKMSGAATQLRSTIQLLRSREIKAATLYRILYCGIIVVAFIPQSFAPLIAFGAAVGMNSSQGTLAGGRIFSSLLLLKLLTAPLTLLFQATPILISAIVCVGRIQTFMCLQKRKDLRLFSQRASSITAMTEKDSKHAEKPSETVCDNPQSPAPAPSIRIQGGRFGWNRTKEQEGEKGRDDAKVVLDIPHLSFAASQLTVIVGPAGCGKSTLLKALLCETPHYEGTVEVLSSSSSLSSRSMAFCDQTPWLMNGSIQKNILGTSTWDHEWYRTVVHACALDEDFAALDKGDQSVLGSNGINLSGGQKQRVAVARAVYARPSIVLLDDVLSGLDRKTERLVVDRLLSRRGLLRQMKLTVIFVTHAVHNLPMADHIVVLDAKGTVSEQGTFQDMADLGGYVTSLDIHKSTEQQVPQSDDAPAGNLPAASSYRLGPAENDIPEPSADSLTRQTGDLAVYMYYFRATGLANAASYVGLQIAWATLGNFPTVWLQWWSNSLAALHPRNAYYLGGYAGFQVGYLAVLSLICSQAFLHMQTVSGKRLHYVLIRAAIAAPMSFFSATDSGVLLNIFSQDLQILDTELPMNLQNTMANCLGSIAQALLLLLASHWMALTYPFLFASFYIVQRFYLRTSRQLRLLDLEAKSPIYTTFLESLEGLATIRAFGWQNDFIQDSRQRLDRSQKPFYLIYCVQRWLTLVLDLIVAILAIVLATLATQLRDSNTAAFTGVSLFNLASLAQTMTTTITTWTLTEVSMGAIARIKNFQDRTPTETSAAAATDGSSSDGGGGVLLDEHWPSEGHIEFKGVTAYYKDKSVKALDGLSLSIRAGEKIGICGRTGSGKSTFVQALFGMIDLSEGSIALDSVDIATIPRDELRERLNAVPQEPFFMPGSFRDNMELGGPSAASPASQESITAALEKVGLLEVVEKAGGLDSKMADDALSHGQRQMFSLGRAVLRPSTIVVLDEATSSVDVDTDRTMQAVIRSAFAGRTVLAVAHRLDTVLDFDRIAVLDGGRLVEMDTPAALLGRDSVFKQLYEKKKTEEEEAEGAR